ncbi:hypothetical protein WMF37_43080 [Sorangium sp. So ce291]|uniref:hypothetical protein n=1 Tax=Sorangium sp. So ce291 TaxID=3133294 RepID=UPI003F5DDC2A
MSRSTSAAPALIAVALGLTAAPVQADGPARGAAAEAPRPAPAEAPRASDGAAAAEAPRPALAATAPRSALRGAVVVAVDDASADAARALARAIYRDPALRPPIDEAAAQALAGEPPRPDAPAAVKELAEVRRSAGRAESEPVARGLLASLGAGAGAALVVAVTTPQAHPVARVLRVAGASYAPIELGATVQRTAEGATAPAATTFDWPGAAAAVRALLAGEERATGPATPGPARAPSRSGPLSADARAGVDLTSKAPDGGSSGRRSVWSSPWFWGPLAGVAAAGVAVLVLSQTGGGDGDTVHLRGRIAP